VGEASEVPELGIREGTEAMEIGRIGEKLGIESGHGIEAEQIQACHAEVDAWDGPIPESGYAEGAAVTDAAA
jgi:hypothetical protein